MAYFISQCSDAPEHSYRLAKAFTALAHTQNGRSYGIFFQSMLRRALACVQSCQNLYCSRTCTKWAYIWHIYSVNAQTRLSMHTVLPEPSRSRTCTKWVCLWHLLSVNAQTSLSMRVVSPEPSLLSHIHKMSVHTAYSFSQCSDET